MSPEHFHETTETFNLQVNHNPLKNSRTVLEGKKSYFTTTAARSKIVFSQTCNFHALLVFHLGTIANAMTKSTTISTPFDSTSICSCISIFHWIIMANPMHVVFYFDKLWNISLNNILQSETSFSDMFQSGRHQFLFSCIFQFGQSYARNFLFLPAHHS